MSFRRRTKFFLFTPVLVALSVLIFSLFSNLKTAPESQERPPLSFILVVLPDTQVYSRDYPAIFSRQTQWIVENKKDFNIVFVTHEGDIVQSGDLDFEWENANQSLSLLDGVVPYNLSIGNHDDSQKFNQFFPYQRFEKEPWWGGHFDKNNDNNYQLFSAFGLDFIIIHLEYNPPEAVLVWADEVLASHVGRRAIVTTHSFLDYGGSRNETGQRIFEALKDNANLFLILCGHVHTESRRTDIINDYPLHQLLADYQARANGGNGWLRILRFVPQEDKIYVQTFSPYLNQFETDENSQFELEYEMEI